MKEDSAPRVVPADFLDVPDAVPRAEPVSRYGNPAQYDIEGRTYYVLRSAAGYRERGVASWYGTKFHGKRTSSGETYDMFGMTAAHKTLPVPTYVRVTNLANGRQVVVKVNDRGPFRRDRILDLSYAAAGKLDLLDHGSGPVEVEAITPGQPSTHRFLEAAITEDPIDAVAVRERVADLGVKPVQIRTQDLEDRTVHRVLIGPFADAATLAAAQQRLAAAQVDARPVGD
ncbi:MAG TPA: septal ring lytic transglycosylase RlpA family protein [Candidatus Binatia bacterium]|nr:septal ring lytic transglycosylase RlpA family protein [Candidatus Binatia bacterium]